MSNVSTKKFTLNEKEIVALLKLVVIQHDISSDNVTADLFITNDVSSVSKDQMAIIRKSTNKRIDVLLLLTVVMTVLNTNTRTIVFTDYELLLFRNELTCYLLMIIDMVEDDSDIPIPDQIQHIIEISCLIDKIQ